MSLIAPVMNDNADLSESAHSTLMVPDMQYHKRLAGVLHQKTLQLPNNWRPAGSVQMIAACCMKRAKTDVIVSACWTSPAGLSGQCHLKALSPQQLPGTHPMMQQMHMLLQAWPPLPLLLDRHTLGTVLYMQLVV
jgi:hypothetical protein